MTRGKSFSPEFRERAVRMLKEQRSEYPSEWAAICSLAEKVGAGPETVRKWLRHSEAASPGPASISADEQTRLRELERENRELRRANEILKAASVFFARELDPHVPTS